MEEDLRKERRPVLSLVASSLFHMLLFALAYYFTNLNINKINPNAGYVQVFTKKNNLETVNFEKLFKSSDEPKSQPKKEKIVKEVKPITNSESVIALNFIDQKADTSSLEQIYSEPTLNVTIKYPAGWTFIDQNLNKKLDGVTFWANVSNINPPPYVHLEVRDRELFNETRFKHSLNIRDAVMYFNDPEYLANYVSQTFYFRTESNEDYSLKLTIKGEEAFNAFTPTFYGMLKSFKFGSAFF